MMMHPFSQGEIQPAPVPPDRQHGSWQSTWYEWHFSPHSYVLHLQEAATCMKPNPPGTGGAGDFPSLRQAIEQLAQQFPDA